MVFSIPFPSPRCKQLQFSLSHCDDIKKGFSFFFMVKPKRGHSNNTQGHWWEPPSLPVIFHLLATVNDSHRDGAGS